MAVVEERIPAALQSEVEAALAWFNQREDTRFEVTGIVDPQVSLAEHPRRLRLVLCGGDRCEQRSFRVEATAEGYAVALLEDGVGAGDESPPAELDFVSLLIANGWFREPRGFPHRKGGRSPQAQILRAALRCLGFAAAWALALWALPSVLVVAAFAGWAAWITPKIRVLNLEFQNVETSA
jgi:hypothetical protein